jgi:hypothetical protein
MISRIIFVGKIDNNLIHTICGKFERSIHTCDKSLDPSTFDALHADFDIG